MVYTGIEIYREYNSRGYITLERESLHVIDNQTIVVLVETCTQGEELYIPQ